MIILFRVHVLGPSILLYPNLLCIVSLFWVYIDGCGVRTRISVCACTNGVEGEPPGVFFPSYSSSLEQLEDRSTKKKLSHLFFSLPSLMTQYMNVRLYIVESYLHKTHT